MSHPVQLGKKLKESLSLCEENVYGGTTLGINSKFKGLFEVLTTFPCEKNFPRVNCGEEKSCVHR